MYNASQRTNEIINIAKKGNNASNMPFLERDIFILFFK